jgi:hypothetical protein
MYISPVTFWTCALVLAFGVGLLAQGDEPLKSGPIGLTSPVPNSPFSAQQFEERTRILADGSPSSVTMISGIYRDGAGRLRIEWKRASGFSDGFDSVDLIDPVARSVVTLFVDLKIAIYIVPPGEPGPFHIGFPAAGKPLPGQNWRTIQEELGTRQIEGIEVKGTRTVQISEDEPNLKANQEMWTSRSLGLKMLIDASGPDWRHVAKLQNVRLGEPDPSLFVIPSDYKIQGQ